MTKSLKHSKGKAIVRYVGAISMFAVAALTTDVAIGYLSNMQTYLHIQSAQSANTVAASSGSSVLASR